MIRGFGSNHRCSAQQLSALTTLSLAHSIAVPVIHFYVSEKKMLVKKNLCFGGGGGGGVYAMISSYKKQVISKDNRS